MVYGSLRLGNYCVSLLEMVWTDGKWGRQQCLGGFARDATLSQPTLYACCNLQRSLRKRCRKPSSCNAYSASVVWTFFKDFFLQRISASITGMTPLEYLQHLLRKYCRKLTTVKKLTAAATFCQIWSKRIFLFFYFFTFLKIKTHIQLQHL